MAITYDSSATYLTPGTTIFSPWGASWSHASIGGSAASNLGIVAAMCDNGGSQTFEPSGTPTCDIGGVSLTWLGYVIMGNVIQAGWVGVWAGLGVPTGTQTVNFSVSSASSAFTLGGGNSDVYKGVGSIGSLVTAQANNSSCSITISSAVGRTVYNLFATWQPSTFTSPNYTARSSQSSVAPSWSDGDKAGASSVNFTATETAAVHWGGVGFEMIPAGLLVPNKSRNINQSMQAALR